MAESEEKLKSILMQVKEECEKAGLKLSIHKTKMMASRSWQIAVEKMETVTTFLDFTSTVDGDCNHEIKMLASWKKS